MKSLIVYAGRKPWLVFLASVLFFTAVVSPVAWSQGSETNKQAIVRQVAQDWIKAGTEQYERGFYKAAEQSLLRAQDYEDYLTNDECEKLRQLLEKTRTAALERERILGEIRTANELAKQGKALEAKEHLENVKDSKFLTKEEQQLITKSLDRINRELGTTEPVEPVVAIEAKEEVKEEPKEIKQPPAKTTVKDVEDELLGAEAETAAIKEAEEPVATGVAETPAAEPEVGKAPAEEGSYIEAINRRRNVIRSHTSALVSNTIAKAETYVSKGDFDGAKEAVARAERTVNKNQLHLGEDVFNEYASQLELLREKIVKAQKESWLQLQRQKRIEAQEAQQRYLEQVEADRSKRITELMDNTQAYMKQQRYEEALGQLESLLALDPLNDKALILKDTLDDTINFQKQLEVQKEASRQKVELLKETDKAAIPYAEEFRLPKNWREIVAIRKPKEAIGRDPANEAVYKSMEEIVDLSDFTPTMPFSQAIELLKNSVEPPLKVWVLWGDLYDNADIDQNTEINVDPISAVPLGTALEHLLKSVSGGFAELDYTVKDGVITIATAESLPSEMEIQIYDVAELVGAAADFAYELMELGEIAVGGGGGGGGGAAEAAGSAETPEELLGTEAIQQNAIDIVQLVQESIDPKSWYDEGGDATIRIYTPSNPTRLIIKQTLKNHKQIRKLLDDLRHLLTEQIAIEARFLTISENFLEEIGIDLDFPVINIGGKFGNLSFFQSSFRRPTDPAAVVGVSPISTGLEGSLAGAVASAITGGYGSIIDDLQASFLIRATQAHTDSKVLNAPKVTVLNGESATIRVQKEIAYVSDWEIEQVIAGEAIAITQQEPEIDTVQPGVVLNITPTISADRKYVILRITTSFTELKDMAEWIVGQVGSGDAVRDLKIQLPLIESAIAQTRVSVPDRGTLLIGGQKISGEAEKSQGVPVLSKIPLIGRLFENRSKIKDEKTLLILIKPTIIIQSEYEEREVAAMERGF
ncbi:Type 3 secretion system secretin [subsurface metagenome]